MKSPVYQLNLFKQRIAVDLIPDQFTMAAHPLCLLAIKEVQSYLTTQKEWEHNFGLNGEQNIPVIGKMFGVLVVETPQKEIRHLWEFSGKLAGKNRFDRFAPPVFDTLTENGFLNTGMRKLKEIGEQIKHLKEKQVEDSEKHLKSLLKERRNFSNALQHQLFESYHFLNQAGEEKSLVDIFKDAGYKNPPAGAGECAAPKLLQYAFQNQLKPVALTEFWWGQSPKSATWKHGQFYAPCKEKCEPILQHMLKGMV